MNKFVFLCTLVFSLHPALGATEYFVATTGNNTNPGTAAAPFHTIQHAADVAQPGDTITVHAGIYREEINPPRGGTSDSQRITYQAAPGERVEIKGSEPIKTWQKVQPDVWKVVLPNKFFGAFNPYSDLLHGDWYKTVALKRHTGTVYLNGDWLYEARAMDDVLKPIGAHPEWFAQVDAANTTIWAQFKDVDPNTQQVEINVRQTIFFNRQIGINYLTIRGFIMDDAATPWVSPSQGQIGLITANWCKGWIIENNQISYSMCSGITLGKYDDPADHAKGDHRVSGPGEGAALMVNYINRAADHGWTKAAVGGHIVRNNTISHCEQAGINGSLGPVFSIITGNVIHDIHVLHWFDGPELAGIKIHGAIDVVISNNYIYHCIRGVWLDWMAQGTHVTGNLMSDNLQEDLFIEVDHGPFLIANNILLTRESLNLDSDGGAFINNLFGGGAALRKHESRSTEYMKAHSTTIAGTSKVPSGDLRFYNNIFASLSGKGQVTGNPDSTVLPTAMEGNVYLNGCKRPPIDKSGLVDDGFNCDAHLVTKSDGVYLQITFDKSWSSQTRQIITSQMLGLAVIPKLPFENADGTPFRIDTDYLGNKRPASPFPGPLEPATVTGAPQLFKVWPKPVNAVDYPYPAYLK